MGNLKDCAIAAGVSAPDFGVVRLKVLLALHRAPELDEPGWSGAFTASIGSNSQVKAAAQHALQEVRLEDTRSA
ncbi:MAG: hypothetical protein ACR2IK_10265 [Chloroflexota bacterium]